MELRPCIDIHNGKVKQLVGGSIQDQGDSAQENYISSQDAAWYARLFQEKGLKNGHVILHASYVKWNEKGIAFCGPSGIGKSTQADLWNKAGAEVINGDRVMIEVARSAVMHGIPFAGSSGICQNQSAPSTAIIVLGQSEENKIWRLEKQVAIKKLYAQSGLNRWSISEVERSLTLLDRLCGMVPIYQMDCRPDESAVELLKNVLNGRGCR